MNGRVTTVYLTEAHLSSLRLLADRAGTSVSALIDQAVYQFLDDARQSAPDEFLAKIRRISPDRRRRTNSY